MTRALAIGLMLFTLAAAGQSPQTKPFFKEPFLLGAHRGGANEWPENTLLAFREASKAHSGVLLETDARLTADGAVVLLHDKTVDRTTNGTGAVSELTLEQVRALDAGYRFTKDGMTYPYRGKGLTIPTLKELLDEFPDARILVELKGSPELADAAIAIIKEAKAENRILLASFVAETMARARTLAPEMAYCYDMQTGMGLLTALRGPKWAEYTPQADVLSVDQAMIPRYKLTPEEIRAIQSKGIRFQVHTINDSEAMKAYVQQNVDSILTDNPSALAAVISESATASR